MAEMLVKRGGGHQQKLTMGEYYTYPEKSSTLRFCNGGCRLIIYCDVRLSVAGAVTRRRVHAGGAKKRKAEEAERFFVFLGFSFLRVFARNFFILIIQVTANC